MDICSEGLNRLEILNLVTLIKSAVFVTKMHVHNIVTCMDWKTNSLSFSNGANISLKCEKESASIFIKQTKDKKSWNSRNKISIP